VAFSANGGFSDSNPLTPLLRCRNETRERPSPDLAASRCPGARQCRRPCAKLEAPSAAKDHHERSCEHPGGTLPPAGQRGQSSHVFIGVRREHRLDPSFARCSRAPSRPRALARLLQVHVSAGTTVDHWNIPDRRRRQPGRLPSSVEGRPSTQGNRRRFSGSGVEDNRASTLPIEIARDGDFAPTPIASGHLLSRASTPVPLSGATWGGRDAAVAVHGCKVCAARGSCDARLPRRRRALTNPRGLPSRGRSRCELGGLPAPDRSRARESRQRLFHHHPNPCEGRSRGYSMARPSPRESGEPLW
jgi:hypothetical protein